MVLLASRFGQGWFFNFEPARLDQDDTGQHQHPGDSEAQHRAVLNADERGDEEARALASGLRVPKSFADALILDDICASQGTAIAVSDESILEGQRKLGRLEGIFAAPEGAAGRRRGKCPKGYAA